jgi:hypothetical protein
MLAAIVGLGQTRRGGNKSTVRDAIMHGMARAGAGRCCQVGNLAVTMRIHFPILSLFTSLVATIAVASGAFAEHPRHRTDRPQPTMDWSRGWQGSSTNPFFEEYDADRAALEDIEIDPKKERRIGDADLEAHLASLRNQGVRVTERGKDVDYLSALVAQLRPLMKHSDRYPMIRVHVANTDDVDARAFPGGSIVVTTGMIEFARS